MRSYLIRGDQITVLADAPASTPHDSNLIQTEADLDAADFSAARLATLWNALPGAEPVKRFKDRATGLKRLWVALEALPITSSRPDSKQARLLTLLQRPDGASMDDLIAATGRQRHSVRGVLSGVIRKKLGLNVSSAFVGETRIYRIGA